MTLGTLVSTTPRRLGPSDLVVGPIGFGTWRLTGSDVRAAGYLLDAAIDAVPEGARLLVDVADVYGLDWGGSGFGTVESHLGAVLAAVPARRARIVLATKGGIVPPLPYDSSAATLRAACDASRRRLGTETIDLYQVHRPDLLTHPAEVAGTLDALVAAGVVRAIGVSNHTPAQQEALAAHLTVPLATTQPEWSVAHLAPMRDGTLDLAMRVGTTPLAWSPLAGGRVASGDGLRPELLATLDELAAREGVDRSTVAVAFLLAHPAAAVVILGTQRPERFTDLAARAAIRLDRADCYRIVADSEGVPLP
ncbi:MAG: aldo/keto reductase family oxidoreductase [Actinomycetes bacterium]